MGRGNEAAAVVSGLVALRADVLVKEREEAVPRKKRDEINGNEPVSARLHPCLQTLLL